MYFTSECHQSVSYWHRSIGNKWRPPKGLAQSEFMEYVKFRALEPVFHISLVRTQNCSLFVLLDSLFAKKVFVKIS